MVHWITGSRSTWFEPALPPTWEIPAEALDTLEDLDKVEGLSAFLNLTAIPTEAEDDTDIEVAFKRYPISLNPEPNQNPLLSHFLINGIEYGSDETPKSKSMAYSSSMSFSKTVQLRNTSTSIQTREFRKQGPKPYLSWYTESGSFSNVVSLQPYTSVDWTAPSTPQSQKSSSQFATDVVEWIGFDSISSWRQNESVVYSFTAQHSSIFRDSLPIYAQETPAPPTNDVEEPLPLVKNRNY